MQAYPKLHDTLARLFNHLEHCDAKVSSALTSQAIDLLPRWIAVTERLPDSEGECLVTDGYEIDACFFYPIINDFVTDYIAVTHWMPLPEPPNP